jgi:hypothetical protein
VRMFYRRRKAFFTLILAIFLLSIMIQAIVIF